jgi:hypothetical protein
MTKKKDEQPASCDKCYGKGLYGEYMDIGIRVPVSVGRSEKPIPCEKCGSVGQVKSSS